MSGQTSTPLATRLARHLRAPVSPDARRRAALHVLDWLGCAVAGLPSPQGQALAALIRSEPADANGASALGVGQRSPRSAAFMNGGLGNVLEMDDVHRRAILHPGPVVIPAALALAEARDANARAFLDAVVRGYEAVIRVGAAVGPGHYAFFHNTASCGPFGSAAACASLLELDEAGVTHALANAGTNTGGLWQVRHSQAMSKQLHTAVAAAAGMTSALLAHKGFTGPAEIFEGPQGFFAATCPGADAQQILADPGAPPAIFATSYKPWPACRHAHAAIDAALLAAAQIKASDVKRIEVQSYRDALTFCDRPAPQSVIDAKFSLQHSVAIVMLRGRPALADFEPEAIRAPYVAELRSRIQCVAGEPFVSAYPAHYGARLLVETLNGAQHRFEVTNALGDPENPLSESGIIAKAMTLFEAGGLARPSAEALASFVLALPETSQGMRGMSAHLATP